VLEIARRRGNLPDCPIVVLTSVLGSDSQEPASLGLQIVLEKPFTLEGYEDIAESLVSLCRSPQL
jgi:hypothetical protein